MKAFLDSSVLVATFSDDHEHHQASLRLFLSCNKQTHCTGVHALAEIYSVLTRMPGQDQASPGEALLFIRQVRQKLAIIALDEDDYMQLLQQAASLGLKGGGIYDAILARCAVKANAEMLYTWNINHFSRLGPDVASRVRTP